MALDDVENVDAGSWVALLLPDDTCTGQSRGGELPRIAVATDDDFMRSIGDTECC